MAKRDKVVKRYTYKRSDGIYEVTEYASGIKSTHVIRTDEQKKALMESASRRSHAKINKSMESSKWKQARRAYDKAIKSINASISSAEKDKEYGDVTGDIKKIQHLIHDTIADTGFDAKRDDRFPASSKLTDEQFSKFFNLAASVKIDSTRPVADNAFPGLRRSYRRAFDKVYKDFSLGAKGFEGNRIQLSEQTMNDAVRLALAAPSIWNQLRKEDRGYGEIDMIFTTLRENHPELDPVKIVQGAYSSYVSDGQKVPFVNYLSSYINRL